MKRYILSSIFLFIVVLGFLPAAASAQEFPDVCQQPENILRNCDFNSGLDHWQTFTEAGGADFTVLQGGGECHAPLCPAAYIVTEDHFVGGLLQQVPVEAGRNYYANIVWLVFDSLVNDESINQAVGGGIGRRIGIDPFGGTDSRSPNVVWSADNWRNDCKICNVEHVTVTAQADTITVFLRLDDTWRLRAAERGYNVPASRDKFWIDDIGLKPVGGDPIAVEAAEAPTDTPVPPPPTDTPPPPPPTDTPPPPPPTDTPASTEPAPEPDTPTAEPELAAAEVAQAETPTTQPETAIETSTPLPTNTPPPPPTLTPTVTPQPTDTATPRPTPRPTRTRQSPPGPALSSGMPLIMGAAGTTVCIAGLAIVVVAVVLAGLVWLYRLGWGDRIDDYDDEFDGYEEPHASY